MGAEPLSVPVDVLGQCLGELFVEEGGGLLRDRLDDGADTCNRVVELLLGVPQAVADVEAVLLSQSTNAYRAWGTSSAGRPSVYLS